MFAEVSASRVMELPHVSNSVAIARERVCAELAERGASERVMEDAALVVSELVGNALRHARPLPSGHVRVSWETHGDYVEVAVSDGGSTTTPTRGTLAISNAGGRGLGIVDHVADAWGVHRGDDVSTVWAMVSAPALEHV